MGLGFGASLGFLAGVGGNGFLFGVVSFSMVLEEGE
jgi:hypothetical protein